MKKHFLFRNGLLATVVLFLSLGINVNAQKKDSCGYIIDLGHNQIAVPPFKGKLTVEIFHVSFDPTEKPVFESEVNYTNSNEFLEDFSPKTKIFVDPVFVNLNLWQLGRKFRWRKAINSLELDSVNKEVVKIKTFPPYENPSGYNFSSIELYVRNVAKKE